MEVSGRLTLCRPSGASALTSRRPSSWPNSVIRKQTPGSLLIVSRADGSTFAWQPWLARKVCALHGRRRDSPGFSPLVSDSGHLEVGICLELPVSESCLEPPVFSGQREHIPVPAWCPAEQERKPCGLRYEGREYDKGNTSQSFLSKIQK